MPESFICQMPHRALLLARGSDCEHFLQDLLSNDISKAEVDKMVYALLLTPQGRFAFDFFVTRLGEGFLLDCDKSTLPQLLQQFNFYKLRAAVEFIPDEREVYFSTEPIKASVCVADPRHYPNQAPIGFRVIEPADVKPAPLSLYHQRRVAAGIPEASVELTAERFALECNLDGLGAIDFHKGCFTGQEVTSRMKRLADGGRKRLFHITGEAPLAAPSTSISNGETNIGVLLSAYEQEGLALIRTENASTPALLEGKKIKIAPLI